MELNNDIVNECNMVDFFNLHNFEVVNVKKYYSYYSVQCRRPSDKAVVGTMPETTVDRDDFFMNELYVQCNKITTFFVDDKYCTGIDTKSYEKGVDLSKSWNEFLATTSTQTNTL